MVQVTRDSIFFYTVAEINRHEIRLRYSPYFWPLGGLLSVWSLQYGILGHRESLLLIASVSQPLDTSSAQGPKAKDHILGLELCLIFGERYPLLGLISQRLPLYQWTLSTL